MIFLFVAFAIMDAGFTAWNAGLYAAHHDPINLAAIFCGAMFVFQMVFVAKANR